MKNIRTHFQKHTKEYLITLSTGLMLFFVLYVYKAYDIQQNDSYSGHSHLFRSIVFGLATSFIFFINEFLLAQKVLKKPLQTLSYISWITWEIFTGTNVTFLLFNYFWNWTELYWFAYFLLLFEYTCVVIFPIFIINKLYQKQSKAKSEILYFYSENGKNKISLQPDAFLYLKSEDNYIKVFYLSDNQVKNQLLRNSLKNIETTYSKSPYILRCHRGYIINPKKIIKTFENNRNFQVEIAHHITLPVSQKYRSNFELFETPQT